MSTPHPIRVLCVDDNRDLADTMAMVLDIHGYEALARYDGRSALAEAEQSLPDACIIDLNMPGMDGDELAVEIRRHVPDCHTVFVALTAMSSDEARERTRRAGFTVHLVKPVEPEKLLAVLPPPRHAEEVSGACVEASFHELHR